MSTVDIDTTEYFKAFTTPREYFSDDESYSNYLNAYADRVDQYARTLKAELLAKMPTSGITVHTENGTFEDLVSRRDVIKRIEEL